MISKKYEEIIEKLENNITDKSVLDFVKNQISDLTLSYTSDIENSIKKYERKIDKLEDKITNIENLVTKIEKDFVEDVVPLDLEPITCPYCNFNFLIEYDSSKIEMRCPECDNVISLDWGNDD